MIRELDQHRSEVETICRRFGVRRLDNLASQRAFAKAGFRKDREFDDVPNGLHVLMLRHRQEGLVA